MTIRLSEQLVLLLILCLVPCEISISQPQAVPSPSSSHCFASHVVKGLELTVWVRERNYGETAQVCRPPVAEWHGVGLEDKAAESLGTWWAERQRTTAQRPEGWKKSITGLVWIWPILFTLLSFFIVSMWFLQGFSPGGDFFFFRRDNGCWLLSQIVTKA